MHQLVVRPPGEPVLATAVGLALALRRRQHRPIVVALVPKPDPALAELLVVAARSQLSLLVITPLPDPTDRLAMFHEALPVDVELEMAPTDDERATAETIRRLINPTTESPTRLLAWSEDGNARGEGRARATVHGRRPLAGTPSATDPEGPEVTSSGDAPSADRSRVVISWSRPGQELRLETIAEDVVLQRDLIDVTRLPALLGGVALGGSRPVLTIGADDLIAVADALDAAPDLDTTSATCLVVAPSTRPRGRLVPTINDAAPGLVISPPTATDAQEALRQLVEADRGLRLLLAPPEGDAGALTEHDPWTGGVRTLRKGPDATVVTHGPATLTGLAGAELADATLGRSVTVLDLGTLHPLDLTIVLTSIGRTGRCLLVEDERSPLTVLPSLAAVIGRLTSDRLRCPVETLVVTGDEREAVAAAIDLMCESGGEEGPELNDQLPST